MKMNPNSKIDTHTHLLVNKSAMPCIEHISAIFNAAKLAGLDAICVTEHREAAAYEQLMKLLFNENVFDGAIVGGALQLQIGVTVFPAAEIELHDGCNVGVHANLQTLLRLNNKKGYYNLNSLRSQLAGEGPFALVAHHMLWPGKVYSDMTSLRRQVHAVEVPAKDLDNAKDYEIIALNHNMNTLGGSDAHTFIQIGACFSILPGRNLKHDELIAGIQENYMCHRINSSAKHLLGLSEIYRDQLTPTFK